MVATLNEFLLGFSRVETFATLFVGIVDLTTSSLTYCSAGHPPAILVSAQSGDAELLDVQSGVVGAFHDMEYKKDVNNKNAAKFYQKGCELNDGFGCARLGFVHTLDKNYQKSKELFLRTCELKDGDGYYGLGLLYYDGNGVERDAKKAKELFEKSCDLGHPAGCNSLGMMLYSGKYVEKDQKRASKLFTKACEMDFGYCWTYTRCFYA